MENIITTAAKKNQAAIDKGGLSGNLVGDKLVSFEKTQDVTFMESARYRDYNALAHLRGIISTEEAQTVYNALGREAFPHQGNGGWAKGITLATKVAVTSLMFQLFSMNLFDDTSDMD